MRIPVEIADKIKQANALNNEIVGWIMENLDVEGMNFERYFWDLVPDPGGEEQEEGEYCAQSVIGEDWFYGDYYWQLEKDGRYLKVPFEC